MKTEPDNPVEKLQAQIDALSEQQQLDTIKLQSLVSKQQAAIDEVQKLADSGATKDQITQNMR